MRNYVAYNMTTINMGLREETSSGQLTAGMCIDIKFSEKKFTENTMVWV